jgi:hypothetical protein
MPRVPAVDRGEAGPLGRLVYRVARRRFGAVPEPMAVMLRTPAGVLGVRWLGDGQ